MLNCFDIGGRSVSRNFLESGLISDWAVAWIRGYFGDRACPVIDKPSEESVSSYFLKPSLRLRHRPSLGGSCSRAVFGARLASTLHFRPLHFSTTHDSYHCSLFYPSSPADIACDTVQLSTIKVYTTANMSSNKRLMKVGGGKYIACETQD